MGKWASVVQRTVLTVRFSTLPTSLWKVRFEGLALTFETLRWADLRWADEGGPSSSLLAEHPISLLEFSFKLLIKVGTGKTQNFQIWIRKTVFSGEFSFFGRGKTNFFLGGGYNFKTG